MSEYADIQSQVFFNVCRLGLWLEEQGYQVGMGEAWRPDVVAAEYARQGKGILLSIHRDRMGLDLIIRKDGKEVGPEDYRRAGETWKALDKDNAWGGDFKGKTAGDYQHFSHRYGGRA
jgi:hypothetical protein